MSAWSGVVVVAVALVVALVAVGQPAWDWHQSMGPGYQGWSYTLFGVTHTVDNGTTGVKTVSNYSYLDVPGQPNMASVFLTVQSAFYGMVAAAMAAAGLSVAAARRKLRGAYAAMALLVACLLGLLIPVYLLLNLPAAAAADLPRLNGQPVTGFQGQMNLPLTGGGLTIDLWGPDLAWYILLVLALVFAFGATEVWSLKPVRKPAAKSAAIAVRERVPPPSPPEPPAPDRQEPVLEEVFVIGSNGLLIKHMSRTLMSEKDRDVVGGMISILSNFVRETFSERDGGSVQEITLGTHRFILCNDSGIVVAVLVTRGATEDIVPRLRHLIALLADRYGDELGEWDGRALEGIEDEIAVLWEPFFLPPPPAD